MLHGSNKITERTGFPELEREPELQSSGAHSNSSPCWLTVLNVTVKEV